MTETNHAALMAAYYMQRELKKYLDDHKAELMRAMGPGDSTSARFDLDGQELPLGKITRTEPRPAWKVTDPEKLLEWAEQHMPELTETRTVLADGPLRELMKTVTTQNGAFTSEGEVIPGITWDNTGGSYVRFTPAKDIGEKLALLAREDRLAGLTDGMLGIQS